MAEKTGTVDLLANMREAFQADQKVIEEGAAAVVDEGDKGGTGGAGGEKATKEADTTTDDPPEDTPTEARARPEGWMPQKDWEAAGKDPDLWKPAGAFLADGEVRKELRGLKRAVKKRDKVIDGLVGERDTVYRAGYDKAMKDLKAERAKAAEEGDITRVMELSDEMAEIREKKDAPKLEGVEDPDDDDTGGEKFTAAEERTIRAWATRNPWYVMDPQMAGYADIIASQYLDEHPDADVGEGLEHAAKTVRLQFPSRFKGTAPARRAATEGGGDDKGRASQDKAASVLQPRELVTMENGEQIYGLYKNFKAAGMFKKDKEDKNGKWTYSDWAVSIGAVKEK